MVRYLPLILEVALLLYALLDCLGVDESRVRKLPKLGWILLIVVVPFAGPLAWIFAGRPARESASQVTWKNPPITRAVAPDDDPEFLGRLSREAAERERLRRWEAELKRREEELRRRGDDPEPDATD